MKLKDLRRIYIYVEDVKFTVAVSDEDNGIIPNRDCDLHDSNSMNLKLGFTENTYLSKKGYLIEHELVEQHGLIEDLKYLIESLELSEEGVIH